MHLISRDSLAPRSIFVNFSGGPLGNTVQAMHRDCRTMLGLRVRVQSAETLRHLLAYLGATPAQLAEFDDCNRRWGQGTVQITLAPGRKNLLRLHRSAPSRST
jgi:hypothetical protein